MIEVGEYVRDCDGFIIKVNNIVPDEDSTDIWYEEKILKGTWKSMIVKHSKNIIDLIEEGDYVNGDEVVIVYGYDEDGNDYDELGIEEVDCDEGYHIPLRNINIKTIVTKEQFASMEYRVKEE